MFTHVQSELHVRVKSNYVIIINNIILLYYACVAQCVSMLVLDSIKSVLII